MGRISCVGSLGTQSFLLKIRCSGWYCRKGNLLIFQVVFLSVKENHGNIFKFGKLNESASKKTKKKKKSIALFRQTIFLIKSYFKLSFKK